MHSPQDGLSHLINWTASRFTSLWIPLLAGFMYTSQYIAQELAPAEQEVCREGVEQAEIGLPTGQNYSVGANLGAH